jgi:hypothetical protein
MTARSLTKTFCGKQGCCQNRAEPAAGNPATMLLNIRPTRSFADRSIGSATPSRRAIR